MATAAITVDFTARPVRGSLPSPRSLEALRSAAPLIMAAGVSTTRAAATRLAELSALRSRAAAMSRSPVVAKAPRHAGRGWLHRAAERRRVGVALRLHFVEIVLRARRPWRTLAVGQSGRLCVVARRAIVVPMLGSAAAA